MNMQKSTRCVKVYALTHGGENGFGYGFCVTVGQQFNRPFNQSSKRVIVGKITIDSGEVGNGYAQGFTVYDEDGAILMTAENISYIAEYVIIEVPLNWNQWKEFLGIDHHPTNEDLEGFKYKATLRQMHEEGMR